jgi:hypothetical protein
MESQYPDVFIEEVVVAGGGEYRGIQRGSRQKGIPDLILFNDPLTGTTLAVVANARHITAQSVRAKIDGSRAGFSRYGRLDLQKTGHCAATGRDNRTWHTSCSTREVEDRRP